VNCYSFAVGVFHPTAIRAEIGGGALNQLRSRIVSELNVPKKSPKISILDILDAYIKGYKDEVRRLHHTLQNLFQQNVIQN